ncbi:MAG TPA: LysM domain-containing protein [Candidatus Dormibacteraeota bacterium]|nr:LysM domain-containing protein [Candidatus Dormibacteraeota bacterium]
MRWRAFALISLGVNVVLLAAWMVSLRPGRRGGLSTEEAAAASGTVKTNFVVRRQIFSWRELESADYPTYIANLRQIGCPDQTIRDIIIADVNSMYAQKRATNLLTAEQQWWRSEPDTNVVVAAAEKSRALEDERRALLVRLLGTNWESGDIVSLPRPSRPGIILDGPVLGLLPADTKQRIQEISVASQERLQAYLEEQRAAGKFPDALELAKLRQQTRSQLERVLTPSQLEEFLLRYSQDANNWRSQFGQLQYFNPTPDEFRAVFRSTDNLDQQIALLGDATDPNSIAQRKALEDQRENAIKVALGTKRYNEYQMLQDPAYRDAVAIAQQAGTPDAARTIYEINLASASEVERIQSDTNLTAEQKTLELKRIELEQMRANTVATGQELPPEPPSTPQQPQQRTHVIRPGDTPAVIALLYGLPVNALRAANPNIDINRLRPGDTLKLPPTPLFPASGP